MLSELPLQFIERLKTIISPADLPGCLQSFSVPKATCFRVNSLKTSVESVCAELTALGFYLTPLGWEKHTFIIPDAQRRALTESAACQQGLLYIQNPSSLLPPLILNPQPGEEVLDLAAAPGGKTLHLAALMQNQGRIAAVEAVKGRFFRLKANVRTYDATIVQTYLKDGINVWKHCHERFDKVLLDTPCSSEAGFNSNTPNSYAYWSVKKIKQMQSTQKRLLFSAIQCLKPGGSLVYSTCTFAPEENEAVIDWALHKFDENLTIEPVQFPMLELNFGLSQWQNHTFHPDIQKSIRILPTQLMKGFYICKIVKNSSNNSR
jgi:NOL1/NOP2/sun family putative RNA methylase